VIRWRKACVEYNTPETRCRRLKTMYDGLLTKLRRSEHRGGMEGIEYSMVDPGDGAVVPVAARAKARNIMLAILGG